MMADRGWDGCGRRSYYLMGIYFSVLQIKKI
jgi:hypothetical protein